MRAHELRELLTKLHFKKTVSGKEKRNLYGLASVCRPTGGGDTGVAAMGVGAVRAAAAVGTGEAEEVAIDGSGGGAVGGGAREGSWRCRRRK